MHALSVCAAAPVAGSTVWVQWTLANRGCPRVVAFAGAIDAGNVGYLIDTLRTLLDAGAVRLIFDLSGVTFVGDAGVPALPEMRRLAAGCSARLDLVCPAGFASQASGVHATLAAALGAQSRGELSGAATRG